MSDMHGELLSYHTRYPLRPGMPREELKSRLHIRTDLFQQVLDFAVRTGRVLGRDTAVALPAHAVTLTTSQNSAIDEVMTAFGSSPYTPPSFAQTEEVLGPELLQYLIATGRLVKVSDTVLYDAETFAGMRREVVQYLQTHGEITVANVRDLFGTSRKYALGLLEDLDRRRVTKRMGDIRILRTE